MLSGQSLSLRVRYTRCSLLGEIVKDPIAPRSLIAALRPQMAPSEKLSKIVSQNTRTCKQS